MIYSAKKIQDSFLSYFNLHDHTIVNGSSIIPTDDKTLLFTNAGMNQFKDYFTGSTPAPYKNAVTSQRCIRAGGKHNDLNQVGFTSRHLTHFSMLGNFSFGYYFKKEAIKHAWNYLTTILKIDKNLLWVTIYKEDEESFLIWKDDIKIETKKIFRLGEKDNFWQMGDTGPCGPCSEIYFDKGIRNKNDENSFPSDDRSERFMEIWNLVFMQYEKKADGSLLPLKKCGIDTGMGLERLASVIQKKESIYQTDLFMPLIKYIEEKSGAPYTDILIPTFHVLCDHIRTAALLIHEGIFPSNEGRGYVLRKIIRRALLFSKKISEKNNFFASLIFFFLSPQNQLYTDLINKKDFIYETILEESIKFFDNLIVGIDLFTNFLKKQNNNKKFSGIHAFTLYDTYGFPLEITTVLAQEKGMEIDIDEYEQEMEKQKNRSRGNQKFKDAKLTINTTYSSLFLGYDTFSCEKSYIKEIYVDGELVDSSIANKEAVLILDQTVFYPTGGGQIHDSGNIVIDNKDIIVLDVKKYNSGIGLTIKEKYSIKKNSLVSQTIDVTKRVESQKHHSAVHLLHKFISVYFNDDTIYQDGSYVCSEYFTLDVVMKQSITYEDKKNLELMINNAISEGNNIIAKNMTLGEAEKIGATAQFTEKYNKDNVRVIEIEGITSDLCGGCHAKNTKDLSFFILKEVISSGTGIKRFIGMVGQAAFMYIQQLESTILKIKKIYSCPIEKIEEELIKKNELQKSKEKEIDELKKEYIDCFTNYIIQSNPHVKKIFIEFPAHLKFYEKYSIEKIKQHYTLFCFYTKKTELSYLIYFYIADTYSHEEKIKIDAFLKNTLKFQGHCKNGTYQGLAFFSHPSVFNEIKY